MLSIGAPGIPVDTARSPRTEKIKKVVKYGKTIRKVL
jgi:hypothetical protein